MTTRTKKSGLLPAVLRTQHQWLRWRAMLVLGNLGLALTLAVIWGAHTWWQLRGGALAEIWGGGVVTTLLMIFIASRFSPESLLVTARQLDGRFGAKGRLEAAAILKDSTSPLAQAQREETALYLARETQARAVRILPWLRGIFVVVVLAHLATLLLWSSLLFVPTAATRPAISAPPPPQGPNEASINWQTPDSATEANPSAEVPATATVESTAGLKNLTLEVSVNGVVKKSITLPDDTASTPGSHEVKVALHLDDLNTQPFDVVSYYLHGRRISAEQQPETTSPVQFVQVRPFRDASPPPPPPPSVPGAPPPINASEALAQIELAQLQAMQDNFALAHSELPPDAPARAKETARVNKEQADLARKTDEIAKLLADAHVPSGTTDLLHQAEPQMDDSAKKIATAQNDAAAQAQQKSLDLVVQGEKSIYQAATTASSPAPAQINQTFDSPPHQLAPREQTLLGQLETLAKNQTRLAQDVGKTSDDAALAPSTLSTTATPPANPAASPTPPAAQPIDPFGPGAEKGSLAERQQRVVQGIATLQDKTKSMPQSVEDALASAQRDSAAALQQLSTEQPDAAREPSAAAALDLEQTIHALNQSGEEQTRQALAQAQQQLNAAASQLRGLAQSHAADAATRLMNLATEMHDAAQNLQSTADHQQDAGSAQGAAQLNELASQIQNKHIAPDLAGMSKGAVDPDRANAEADTLEDLARQAAGGTTAAQPSPQDVAGLADSLQRTEATLAHLADKAGQSSAATSSNTTGADSSSSSSTPTGGTPGSQPAQQTAANSAGTQPGPQPASQPGQPAPSIQSGDKPTGPSPSDASTSQAFHEALEDLKNQSQQSAKLVPNGDASAVEQVIIRYDKDTSYRDVTGADVVHLHADLQQPLEKLIVDVQALQQHEQRTETVQTPDLDETPAVYRPAVSHYFEDVSRDYHATPPAPAHP